MKIRQFELTIGNKKINYIKESIIFFTFIANQTIVQFNSGYGF